MRIFGHGDCRLSSNNVLNVEKDRKVANMTSSNVLNVEKKPKYCERCSRFVGMREERWPKGVRLHLYIFYILLFHATLLCTSHRELKDIYGSQIVSFSLGHRLVQIGA